MKRGWPWWLRCLCAVGLTVLLYWPYAGWHWRTEVRSGPGLFALSPTGAVVRKQSTMAIATQYIERMREWPLWNALGGRLTAWRLSYALTTALPAALIGVLAFAALTRWFGPKVAPDPSTRCRKCDYILAGLSRPRCPECGEPI
ncbi:MAG TPA: hypothetical protein VMV94_16980 [Phycisphaerae bacterium]|nr:hypothetical protein [Phycisphaerae bacterium]